MYQNMDSFKCVSYLLLDDYATWSRECATALVEYYEQLEDDLGEPIEFDRVAIRCEWSEFDSVAVAASEYDLTPDGLRGSTTVLEFAAGVAVQDF